MCASLRPVAAPPDLIQIRPGAATLLENPRAMFESANLKHRLDKAVYKREAAKLRQALLDAQYDLKQNGRFPVLILIAGVEGAGQSETVNLLNEGMDPRHIRTSAFFDPSDEERERRALWGVWRGL